MLADLAENHAQLNTRWSALWRKLAPCTNAQLDFRPPTGGWSQLGIVEHLVLVERGIIRQCSEVLKPLTPLRQTGMVSEIRLRSMLWFLGTNARIHAPIRHIIPQGNQSSSELRAWQAETTQQWAALLERIDGERRNAAVFRHPIGGWLNMHQALRFVIGHFDHHGAQFRRVRTAEGYPEP